MSTFFTLLFLAIFVEAFTEILVTSSIFRKPREFLAVASDLLGELVHCGYCTSVWVSMTVAWIIPSHIAMTPFFYVNYIISIFVLHRVSNMIHELFSKWTERRPMSFAVHKTETVIMPGLDNE